MIPSHLAGWLPPSEQERNAFQGMHLNGNRIILSRSFHSPFFSHLLIILFHVTAPSTKRVSRLLPRASALHPGLFFVLASPRSSFLVLRYIFRETTHRLSILTPRSQILVPSILVLWVFHGTISSRQLTFSFLETFCFALANAARRDVSQSVMELFP